MGRRWGKTVLGGAVSLATAANGGKVAWVVPEYKNGRPLWRWVESTIGGIKGVRVNRSERIVEFPHGGVLGIHSADNPDSIRGEWYHLVIVDEAARVSEQAWQEVIQPTLADVDGDAILISTPKGHNWFFTEWARGQNAEYGYASWKAPSRDNPSPQIQAAAERARSKVPELVYLQEWEAEFIQGSGAVFRRVRDCVRDGQEWPIEPYQGNFIGGLDFGQKHDFTVLVVMDAATRKVVAIDRFNKVDWAYQRERIKAMYHTWHIGVIVAESNSIGQPNIEALVEDNIAIQPFVTTNATKSRIIQRLVMDIENRNIVLPDDPNLLSELEAFEQEQTPTGLMKYSAPEGGYDDCVMALALCNDGAQSGGFIS